MTSFALSMLRGIAMNETEKKVLARMKAGEFTCEPSTRTVRYFHHGRRRWYTKKIQYHARTGRAKVNFNGGKTIYLNRLFWLWTKREVPSEVIDHKDGNRFNDDPDNLQAMTWDDSNRQGGEKGYDALRRYHEYADSIPE